MSKYRSLEGKERCAILSDKLWLMKLVKEIKELRNKDAHKMAGLTGLSSVLTCFYVSLCTLSQCLFNLPALNILVLSCRYKPDLAHTLVQGMLKGQ